MTPMQELIEYEEVLEKKAYTSYEIVELLKKKMAELLETEKQFAKDMFEAGERYKESRMTPFKEVPKEQPDFETFYTQYEK